MIQSQDSYLKGEQMQRFGLRHPSSPRSRRFQFALGLISFALPLMARPGLSAQQIYLSYGILERSIPIESLATYAREGTIDEQLEAYARYATPKQLEQLRTALTTEIDLSAVAVSQFLYTPQGEALLRRLGEIIQSESRQPGFYALRSALILAAADSDQGLTLLNVLRQFPTQGLRVDLGRSLEIATALQQAVDQTDAAVSVIQNQANQEAQTEAIASLANLPNPIFRGPFAWQRATVTLTDSSRDRTFPVDLYVPRIESAPSAVDLPLPVVVVSHGLGSDRTSYAYIARHLASYGFFVAVPEHPGSSDSQLQALLTGRANSVAEPGEFLSRPLDIQYLLDYLSQQATSAPWPPLDLQNVGVIGQSFGGYTVLALAGAAPDSELLGQRCADFDSSLNLSLLLQCQSRLIFQPDVMLRDPRVAAAIAVNPVGSIVFGPEGFSQIDIPLMVVTGNADTVAPALPEQIRPFTWLTNPERYLVLIRGATHFSTIAASEDRGEVVPVPSAVIGPEPELAQRYLEALSLAFFQVYIANEERYQPLLSSTYVNRLGREPLPLSLIESLSATALKTAIANPDAQTSLLKLLPPDSPVERLPRSGVNPANAEAIPKP